MNPPVLIAPADPIDDPAARANFERLKGEVALMSHGDVIVFDVPIEIYHRVDGYWIRSEDLPEMLAAEKDAPHEARKREPLESSYIPPGVTDLEAEEAD